jgi:flagellar basal-body rod modification protein FlgD
VAKNKTSLSQADFMNLFVAQLQYQNPLEPLDQYQMASQMAQFSSLEALNTLNDTVKSMVSYQATQNSLQVASLVGKKVEISGNTLSLEGGTAGEGLYQLAAGGKVTVKIYNSNDQLVRTIDAGTKGTSKEKIAWDGRDQLGGILADGLYRFEVSAVDSKGQSISAVTSHSATVRGISFENGTTYLDLGLEKVTLSDLNAILG